MGDVDGSGQRDPAVVAEFVERFATILVDAGFPRMPARVLTALLTSDSGRLTSAELGELLRVSPAAVSGAVRYLAQVDLVSREREPGSRRDRYRVHDHVWYEATANRDRTLLRWEAGLADGVEALGADTPAGRRLADSLEFFGFLRVELADMMRRWRERRP
ncbi:MarR family transcriptional regulator [Kitasatospora sp. YST-16]|uniref:GbsR/MarR family transcriptional regulator n=1 Tax=Kitasatospora sp. YST-16 TaxID=2998080 RepID=UPI0022852396|nr:MarR family transcriptional regulator [Kitasatospora sp. YST-16]WAL74354.1 MarR family transcriptional regulator [Kitasatospora sp. YST-16]WNW40420.1 MarR family transcriptional regulator [Streptomyces sp. Li-HN-5-13]